MRLLGLVITAACLTAALPARAQTARFSGTVRVGETYSHAIGRGLSLRVTTDGIRVGRAGRAGESDNFARCVTPPVHGPNDLDFLAADFDPARGNEALGRRRSFEFVLSTAADESECEELARAIDPDASGNRWHSHPTGKGKVALSNVRLTRPASDQAAEIRSFRFTAVVSLPRRRAAHRRS